MTKSVIMAFAEMLDTKLEQREKFNDADIWLLQTFKDSLGLPVEELPLYVIERLDKEVRRPQHIEDACHKTYDMLDNMLSKSDVSGMEEVNSLIETIPNYDNEKARLQMTRRMTETRIKYKQSKQNKETND